jgi:metallo-beta-lactamase family protein
MRVTFLGAAGGEVTGSAYLLESPAGTVLVDCGLFQGSRKDESYNRIPMKGALRRLNAVVLTHAHLDHTGRLPLLTRADYQGPIFATPATTDVTNLILRDSAHLQKADVERENRRRLRQGQTPREPRLRHHRG